MPTEMNVKRRLRLAVMVCVKVLVSNYYQQIVYYEANRDLSHDGKY